jgi:hypothetical protein
VSEPQITKEIPDFQQPPDVGVLRNGAFLRLWIAQLLTQIGGNVVLYGLTVLGAQPPLFELPRPCSSALPNFGRLG